jgi:hypothetical protein
MIKALIQISPDEFVEIRPRPSIADNQDTLYDVSRFETKH